MLILKHAVISACEVCRSLLSGLRCLREVFLLCGGMAVFMVMVHVPVELDDLELTTVMRAGAEARPDQPIYRIDLQSDKDAVWLRRGDAGLDRISLITGQVQERIPIFSEFVSDAAHSRDGRVHAWSQCPALLTILRDGVPLVDEPQFGTVVKLSVSMDGSRVAAADDKRKVQIWDLVVSPPKRIEICLESLPIHIEWSADGDRLLIGCGDGWLTLLSADGRMHWTQNNDRHRPTAIAWSPDGDCVAVGQFGGDLIVLDADDGTLRWRSRQDSLQVSTVSFSRDGQRLAAAGFDRTVNVISAADGRRLQKMPGHYDAVSTVQFLPDGDRIVSGSLDGTLRIWSASFGRQLQKL